VLRGEALAAMDKLLAAAVEPENSAKVVTADQIYNFLKTVESKDYRGIKGAGEPIFKAGWVIPNHAEVFKNYPSSRAADGTIRYVFFSVTGDGGRAYVDMFVKSESGEIVSFNCMEYWK
jgi:hypothetical protein